MDVLLGEVGGLVMVAEVSEVGVLLKEVSGVGVSLKNVNRLRIDQKDDGFI